MSLVFLGGLAVAAAAGAAAGRRAQPAGRAGARDKNRTSKFCPLRPEICSIETAACWRLRSSLVVCSSCPKISPTPGPVRSGWPARCISIPIACASGCNNRTRNSPGSSGASHRKTSKPCARSACLRAPGAFVRSTFAAIRRGIWRPTCSACAMWTASAGVASSSRSRSCCGDESGRRTLYRDARGRVIDVPDDTDVPPQPGRSVVTTLDSVIQLYAERELDRVVEEWKPQGACALVQDPASGEILAMASRPAFDPNHPEGVSEDAWKNRAVAWIYEPGSTFKPFVVAGAMDRGRIHPDEEIDCAGGETRLASRVFHDTHPYGLLNLGDVLVKSSNIGMSRIGAGSRTPSSLRRSRHSVSVACPVRVYPVKSPACCDP